MVLEALPNTIRALAAVSAAVSAAVLAAFVATAPAGAAAAERVPDDGFRALGPTASAPEAAPRAPERPRGDPSEAAYLCRLIGQEAERVGMNPHFFARLIWKESRFDIKAVSPVGAQGVAQFMPYTAKERGLEDPYDPDQAIPASADYLAALKGDFGNWGLAAAAYNGGPSRVERFQAGTGGLPLETRDYVHSITFRPAEWFRESGREVEPRPLAKGKGFQEACSALPVMKTRANVLAGRRYFPWGVQVAQGVTQGAARRAFDRVRSRFSAVLGGRSVGIYRNKRRTGVRWAARVGAGSRREAGLLCARLRQAGGACVVLRN